MRASFLEKFPDEIRSTIDDCWLTGEIWRRGYKAHDLDDTGDLIQADLSIDSCEAVEDADAR